MAIDWLRRWREAREHRVVKQRAIPDALWQTTLHGLPFLARRSQADLQALRRLATLFLDSKEFSGAGGLAVTDEMAVCIAAQACLPVLRFGLGPYQRFVGIVVHADEVVARREVSDEHGVVHEYDEVLTGEAMEGGPVMLSWRDVRESGATADLGYNVVIHEFAHVIDMGDGLADGIPPLPDAAARKHWRGVLDLEYERFCRSVEDGEQTVLDPYGAQHPSEFFAVAVEAFFVKPQPMRAAHPWLYPLLAQYFGQDPAAPST